MRKGVPLRLLLRPQEAGERESIWRAWSFFSWCGLAFSHLYFGKGAGVVSGNLPDVNYGY